MSKIVTRNARRKINHAFSYEGYKKYSVVGKKAIPFNKNEERGLIDKLKFWKKPIANPPPTLTDFIIKAGPIKSNEIPIQELAGGGTASTLLSPDLKKIVEKTWIPEPGLTVYDTEKGQALTAEIALNKHINEKRWMPQYFQNPMQGYDYLVYESLLKNTILGPLAWSLVKFIMGTGFDPTLELRNPSGDKEADSALIEKHKYIIDNLKYIDRCISEKSDDDGIDISLNSKFSNLIHNMLTFNRSCAVYQYDEENPITLNPLGNTSKGKMQSYPNIATGLVEFHPRDMGIVKISSKSKKMESVQINQIQGMVKVKQMIYMWNSQNAAAIYNAKYYGGSILMPMIEPGRFIRTQVSSVLPTVAENMAGGLYHIFIEPEGGTEAQRQLEYQTITEAAEFGTANVFMLAPDRVKYENVNFDPKINDLITSFDTMVKYVIACFNLPQIGSYDEAAANHATAEEKMQFTISTAINPLREWIGEDFSKQWYQRNFVEIYGEDYPKLVETFRIKVEFKDLQIETLKDRAETLISIKNAGIQLDEEKIEEILQIEGLKEHMTIIEDNPGDDFEVNDKGNDNFGVKSKGNPSKKNDSKNLKARVLEAEQVLEEEEGQWITSNGQHILIPNGRDKGEVVKEHFEKLENKSEPKSKTPKEERDDLIKELKDHLKKQPKDSKNLSYEDRASLKEVGWNTSDKFYLAQKNEIPPGMDVDFGDFEKPDESGWLDSQHARYIVLGTDDATIKHEDLPKYEKILKTAIRKSKILRDFNEKVKAGNKVIKDQLEKSNTVYRGLGIDELVSLSENGGSFGEHKRDKYGAEQDFTSTSIDKKSAEKFAEQWRGMIAELDVSNVPDSSIHPIEYELRRDVRVTRKDGKRGSHRPYEKFGGSHSSGFQHEAEVHLKNKTKPVIRELSFAGKSVPEDMKEEIAIAVKKLEKAQNKPIRVNYGTAQAASMSASKDDELEKAIKRLKELHPNMSRQSLIDEIHRWS